MPLIGTLVHAILAAAPELDELAAERIARRLLVRIDPEPERPVSARAVADFLGLEKTDWVYRHARELGGFRLGQGAKPRWRFLRSEIPARLRAIQNAMPERLPAAAPSELPAARQRQWQADADDSVTRSGAPLLDFEAA